MDFNKKKKKLKFKIDSAAVSGGKGKSTYFMYFLRPPLKTIMYVSMFCIIFTSPAKFLFFIYLFLIIR